MRNQKNTARQNILMERLKEYANKGASELDTLNSIDEFTIKKEKGKYIFTNNNKDVGKIAFTPEKIVISVKDETTPTWTVYYQNVTEGGRRRRSTKRIKRTKRRSHKNRK